MTRPSYFYDIESANQLFQLLKTVWSNLMSTPGKQTQDLLFLIFGLTHLREWIAPDYDPEKTPITPQEHFYQKIFKLKEFNILRGLCNRSKHMLQSESVMGALYKRKIDDWPNIDSVTNFDRGPPIAYFVDSQDVEEVIRIVIRFYDEHWFKNQEKN